MSEVEKFKCIGYMVARSRLGGAEYVHMSDFDRVTAERDAALEEVALLKKGGQLLVGDRNELQQRLTAADERVGRLELALKFYADGDHLLLADPDAWDTCSGEPVNFLHDDAGTASVEDGSIAKAALKPAEGGGDD